MLRTSYLRNLLVAVAIGASLPGLGCHQPSHSAPGVDGGSSALRVLFIGNSYTFVNDLPAMLARIAATAGTPPTIAVDQIVQGGHRLQQHWNDGIAQARIDERTWTHVVLQGQSLESSTPEFVDYAQRFGDLIVEAGARPTLFVTWARAPGDGSFYPYPGSPPAAEQDGLTSNYARVAQRWPRSVLACVAEAFGRSLRQHPAIALHQSDLSHPTLAGTYLAASTFYVALTGNPVPPASEVPDGLSAADATVLRDVARIGSSCADVRVKAELRLHDESGRGLLVTTPPFDYGRAAGPISSRFTLENQGDTAAGIVDAQALAPPFSWTTGGYPGVSGTDVDGTPPCADTLAPGRSCRMAVSYSAATTGAGQLTLRFTDAYITDMTRALQGTATREAVLTVRPHRAETIEVPLGETAALHLMVTNRGGAPASQIHEAAEIAPPFHWGPTGPGGAFPGGSGSTSIDGVTYDYCTTVLDVGHECVLTASFSPTQPGVIRRPLTIEYSTAEGPYQVTQSLAGYAPLPAAGP